VVPEIARKLYDLTIARRLDEARDVQYRLLKLFDGRELQLELEGLAEGAPQAVADGLVADVDLGPAGAADHNRAAGIVERGAGLVRGAQGSVEPGGIRRGEQFAAALAGEAPRGVLHVEPGDVADRG
jgi:hypothetical protein